jgi:methyltransferase (TIGR00027 family)
MEDQVASKTAMVTSLMRSLHSRADPKPLINDPWGDKLVSGIAIKSIEQHAYAMMSTKAIEGNEDRIVDTYLRASPAYTNVVIRTRYTEDALHEAISNGFKQYVVIGAGFDSYSFRRPAEAQQLDIFEIDHPATQSLKRQWLYDCEIPDDDLTHYLSADLGKERLGLVLSRSSFRELQKNVRAVGEPLISGFHPASLKQDLLAIGLELEEDLDEFKAVEQYDAVGANGFRPQPGSHIARVRVLGTGV